MRLRIAFSLLLLFTAKAYAQATVNLTATKLLNLTGAKVTGRLCLAPANNAGSPQAFSFGGGGQSTQNAICVGVSNGSFATTVVDTALSNPANLCLAGQLINASAPQGQQLVRTWNCLQPASSGQTSWCTTTNGVTTCNLDDYIEPAMPGTQIAAGPPGVNWRGTYTSTTVYGMNDGVAYGGSSYVSTASNNTSTPGGVNWLLIAQAGSGNIAGLTGDGNGNVSVQKQLTASTVAAASLLALAAPPAQDAAAGSAYALLVGPHSWSAMSNTGDSIDAATGASTQNNGYIYRLGKTVGITPTNHAIPGQAACDLAEYQMLPFTDMQPPDQGAPLYTMKIGTNDAYYESNPTAYRTTATLCRQAAETWITSPASTKWTGASFTGVPTNWTLDTRYAAVIGLQSTTHGAVSTWSVTTNGGPIAIWYRLINGDGGTFTYSVDGGASVPLTTAVTPAIANGSVGGVGIGVALVTGVSGSLAAPISHSVTITVTSSTSASNTVHIVAVGTTPPSNAKNPPYLWVIGVPKQLNDANSAITAAYNSDEQADVSYLSGLGFNMGFADIRSCLGGTAAEMYDNLHPNDLGHQHMFNCVVRAIAPVGGGPGFYPIWPYTFATSTSAGNQTYWENGGTFTLNSQPAGTIALVSNYSASANTTITGLSTSYTLGPGEGVIVSSVGSGTWQIVASYVNQSAAHNVYGQWIFNAGAVLNGFDLSGGGSFVVNGWTFTWPTVNAPVSTQALNTWSPSFTGLTQTGTATWVAQYTTETSSAGKVIRFWVTITPGTSTSSAGGGGTYFTLPTTPAQNGTLSVSDNSSANIGTGLVSTSGLAYLPAWGTDTTAITISGQYLSN